MDENSSGYTRRAFITGVLLCAVLAVSANYCENVTLGSNLATDHLPAGAVFLFFLFTFAVNSIMRKTGRGFSPSEQLLVYSMLIVSASVSTLGFAGQVFSILAAPFYYSTPQNRWAELINPHLKSWLVPRDTEAIRSFFEGLPAGAPIPYGAWLRPMLFWLPFILVFYFIMLALMVIFRKQWVERERLAYPLIQLSLRMVEDDGRGAAVAPFYRNRLMWTGFAIPFILSGMSALHHYFSSFPPVPQNCVINIFRGTIPFYFWISFPVLGLAFLINRDITFSLWFFSLLATVFRGVFNLVGVSSTENLGIYGTKDPFLAHLGTGAFFTLVCFQIWIARKHLKDVWMSALRKDAPVDDSGEALSYRAALFGLSAGVIFCIGWLTVAGLPALWSVVFLASTLFFFVGLTYIVAQSGLPTLTAPGTASSQLVSSFGSSAVGDKGLVALGLTYVFAEDTRTFPMSPMAHSLKISEKIAGKKHFLFAALALALLIGIGVSLWFVLRISYIYGGINLNHWYYQGGPVQPFIFTAEKILFPTAPNGIGWFYKGVGAVIMFGLTYARSRFLWWPLHPIGFVVGPNHWINYLWFSIFLAWLFKTFVLRYGGAGFYKKAVPLFLGLVLGQYVTVGIWFLVDALTGMTLNRIFWI